jgi:hypothetical protein
MLNKLIIHNSQFIVAFYKLLIVNYKLLSDEV